MSKKVGKVFEFGWPYITSEGNLFYYWPNEKIKQSFNKREGRVLENFLLEKLKKYSKREGIGLPLLYFISKRVWVSIW